MKPSTAHCSTEPFLNRCLPCDGWLVSGLVGTSLVLGSRRNGVVPLARGPARIDRRGPLHGLFTNANALG
jgi:hypothetical protein